tara:strand:+ start:1084 stop:1335 length:252 start_codon:yes stop_codon:yes gene_type:complete
MTLFNARIVLKPIPIIFSVIIYSFCPIFFDIRFGTFNTFAEATIGHSGVFIKCGHGLNLTAFEAFFCFHFPLRSVDYAYLRTE